jgi:hydrogenase small subunit
MTGVITYMLAFDRLPPLDRQGRPAMFYGQRLHDKCYRRPHFDAGQFVEKFDDEGARKGYCLYKVGCKGPTTYNACSTVEWNGGLSWPVKSGHGCLGCAEDNFWDKGSFYSPVTNLGASTARSPTSVLRATSSRRPTPSVARSPAQQPLALQLTRSHRVSQRQAARNRSRQRR